MIILDGVVKLALVVILDGSLLLGILNQDQALANAIKFIFEHDHALEIDGYWASLPVLLLCLCKWLRLLHLRR